MITGLEMYSKDIKFRVKEKKDIQFLSIIRINLSYIDKIAGKRVLHKTCRFCLLTL
jgi:hypothetical protein